LKPDSHQNYGRLTSSMPSLNWVQRSPTTSCRWGWLLNELNFCLGRFACKNYILSKIIYFSTTYTFENYIIFILLKIIYFSKTYNFENYIIFKNIYFQKLYNFQKHVLSKIIWKLKIYKFRKYIIFEIIWRRVVLPHRHSPPIYFRKLYNFHSLALSPNFVWWFTTTMTIHDTHGKT